MSDFKAPTTILEFALYYASLGWRIIPNHTYTNGKCTCHKKAECPSGGKHPRLDDWVTQATTNEEQIREWFEIRWPRANIGVVTGKGSGMFILDVDQKEGGVARLDELVRKHQWDWRKTPMAHTGSDGLHFVLLNPPDLIVPTKARLETGVGIDVRGEGGQAVLAPSTNQNGSYIWEPGQTPWEAQIQPAPAWLLSMISAAALENSSVYTAGDFTRFLNGFPEGERDEQLYKTACSFRGKGYSYEAAINLITEAAANCDPPFDKKVAIAKVQNAYKKFPEGSSYSINSPYRHYLQSAEWQEPVDFDNPHLPPFPVEVFPDWLKNYVEAVAETTQTPVDMAGTVALSVLAAACARKVIVPIQGGWMEKTLSLHTLVCSESGTLKSPVFGHMVDPIEKYEKELKALKAPEVKKAEARILALEKEYKALIKEADAKDFAKLQEAANKALEIEKLQQEAKSPDLMVDDITPEKLSTMLYEQGGRIALLSSEPGMFSQMGRYQKNGDPNMDVYLKGYSGETLKVNRMSGRSELVYRASLTLGICAQKKALRGLLNHAGSGRGLFARFLFSVRPEFGEVDLDAPAIPPKIEKIYHDNIVNLLKMGYREDFETNDMRAAHYLNLSPEGRTEMREFRAWQIKEIRQGELSKNDYVKEWASKLHGQTARIAGLLSLAENAMEACPYEFEIHPETVKKACKLGQYFAAHAIAAFRLMEEASYYDDARKIKSMLFSQRLKELTLVDAARWTYSHGQKLDNAISLLVSFGYIRQKQGFKDTYETNTKWLPSD